MGKTGGARETGARPSKSQGAQRGEADGTVHSVLRTVHRVLGSLLYGDVTSSESLGCYPRMSDVRGEGGED